MFTGIVETTGTIATIEPLGEGRRFAVETDWGADLAIGDSVAVDGVCLTVVETTAAAFTVEAVRETLHRTIIGTYVVGSRVNLERPLAIGDRLDGHFVQGHVDVVAKVTSIERLGENRYIDLALPGPNEALVAPQGSITVNGVSLTVLELTDPGVRLSIIPHTWEVTMFSELEEGDGVNVEYDLVARYLKRLLETRE
jgi:riboflavin synthase